MKRVAPKAKNECVSDNDDKEEKINRQKGTSLKFNLVILFFLLSIGIAIWYLIVPHASKVTQSKRMPTPEILEKHCHDHIGEPRIEKVTEDVYVAVGYDLANTIIIRTSEGHVVVDVGMSPSRARKMKEDLLNVVGDAEIHTIVYTHSHIDHVGGASLWFEEGKTKIWSTDKLVDHFFKQYGVFRKTETLRGARQFGAHTTVGEVPCSGIGKKPDIHASLAEAGFVLPTNTFSGYGEFYVGGVKFELYEAHGETHDMLFVWIPSIKILCPGDNYYRAFPNLYTIRGSSPRPVRSWIASLDEMRLMEPEALVPSHTEPVIGKEKVMKQLRDYRDGIAWILLKVIRGANAGFNVDELAESIGLPEHLQDQDALDELYGQIDWSVRAIFTNELGWFDGRAEELYRLGPADEAQRTIELMGGTAKVKIEILKAEREGEYRWALHLLEIMKTASPLYKNINISDLKKMEVPLLKELAETVYNTNGRGYLIEYAKEIEGIEDTTMPKPVLTDMMKNSIPIDLMFEVMSTRLISELAINTHESAIFSIGGSDYYVTVRYGIAEISKDKPLPDMPEPVAKIETDASTWRDLGLNLINPANAFSTGKIKVTGDQLAFLTFIQRFERGS